MLHTLRSILEMYMFTVTSFKLGDRICMHTKTCVYCTYLWHDLSNTNACPYTSTICIYFDVDRQSRLYVIKLNYCIMIYTYSPLPCAPRGVSARIQTRAERMLDKFSSVDGFGSYFQTLWCFLCRLRSFLSQKTPGGRFCAKTKFQKHWKLV